MSSTSTLLLRGATLRVVKTLAGIIIGFVMMPFLLNELGTRLYGLWITIGSVVASYYLLDLGFSQAVTRYVARYIHQKEYTKANKIIVTSLIIYSVLGLLVVALSVVAAFFGADYFMQSAEDIDLIQILLIISGVSLAFEFPAKAFPGVISAYMRFDTIAFVNLIKLIADACLIFWVIKAGYGLVAMSLIAFVTSIFSTLFYVYYCTRLFKQLQLSMNNFEPETAKELFHFSKWVFVNDLNALLKAKMDIWFIAYFASLSAVAVYYVAVRLVEYAVQFLIQATGMSSPLYAKYHALNDEKKLAFAVVLFLKINVMLGVTIAVSFYVVGDYFIHIWMGDSFNTRVAYICLLVIGVGRLISFMTYPFGSLLLTIKRHDVTAKVSILESLIAAGLSIILIPKYELIGAAIAIGAPLIFCRVFIISVYSARFLDVLWKPVILRIMAFALASIFIAVELRSYLDPVYTYGKLVIDSCVVSAILAFTSLISLFNAGEIRFVLNKILGKRKI